MLIGPRVTIIIDRSKRITMASVCHYVCFITLSFTEVEFVFE